METISWTDRVKNEEYYRVKEARNALHTINRRKGNWIGHILHRKLSSKIHHGRKDKSDKYEEENISKYWITLRKREDIGN